MAAQLDIFSSSSDARSSMVAQFALLPQHEQCQM
jgi:hypothetical protein